jgi:hypothetical protein
MKPVQIIIAAVVLVNAWIIILFRTDSPAHSSLPVFMTRSIQTGDVVVRRGKGLISDKFRRMSLVDKSFSHSGLIVKEGDEFFVYHMYQDMAHPGLKKEKLNDFIDPQVSSASAVYRYDLNKQQCEELAKNIHLDYVNHCTFDDKFELGNEAYYCTEWISHELTSVTNDSFYIPESNIDGFRYIAPDNLYLNQHTQLIFKVPNR